MAHVRPEGRRLTTESWFAAGLGWDGHVYSYTKTAYSPPKRDPQHKLLAPLLSLGFCGGVSKQTFSLRHAAQPLFRSHPDRRIRPEGSSAPEVKSKREIQYIKITVFERTVEIAPVD